MIKQFLFNCLSENNQMQALYNKGIELRSYQKNNRRAFLYHVDDFFVEVIFTNDDRDLNAEKITTFQNVDEWNSHLENSR